jgi:hypothetical protein
MGNSKMTGTTEKVAMATAGSVLAWYQILEQVNIVLGTIAGLAAALYSVLKLFDYWKKRKEGKGVK